MSMLNRGGNDTRVMSLVFDNSRFDSPAKNSLSIIERLKGALEASASLRLFEDINRGVRSVTLAPLEDALGKVHAKMSALDSMTDQWSRNFANSVEQLVKSVTIDQLTAGWEKYENKTQAVQTIMAATAEHWADQAQQMNYVNSQLEKLNWFTDETSYNFVDMTSNVGKFINAGVKLDDAVTAMEGISTWAARSGANVHEASRAMYNLSQAMGSGKVQLVDWRSIELANMASMEFRKTVLKTGKEMGILKEISDGVYETLDGTAITAKNFREDMKEGWFTSELLVESLKKYGSFTDALNKSINRLDNKVVASQILRWIKEFKAGTFDAASAAEEADVSIEALTTEIEALSDASYDFGREAFQAAQEAKTFTEAIDATKDAASTAWMNIYESLFGNYLDQKGLWTDLAEKMYDAFVEPINQIGDAITGAFEKEAIIGEREWNLLKENGIVSDDFIDEIIEAGKKFGYITDTMRVDAAEFSSSLEQGWFTADLFDKIFEYKNGMVEFSDTTRTGITDIRDFLKLAEKLRHDEALGLDPEHWAYDYSAAGFNEDSYRAFVDTVTRDFNKLKSVEGDSATITDEILKNAAASVLSLQRGTEVTIDEVDSIIEGLNREATSYDKVARSVDGLTKVAVNKEGKETVARMEGSYYWSEALSGSMDVLTEFVRLLGERFSEVFGSAGEGEVQDFAVDIYNLVNRILDLVENSDTLRVILDTLFSIVRIKASLAIAKIIILKDIVEGLVKVVTSFVEGLTGEKKTISEIAKMLGNAAAGFASWLHETGIIESAFDIIASVSGVAGTAIRAFIDTFFGIDNVTDKAGKAKNGIVGTFTDIARFISGVSEKFGEFKDKVQELDHVSLEDLKTMFGETVGAFVEDFEGFSDIKSLFESIKTWAKDALKSVGIDLDAIAKFFKSAFNTGGEVVTVWLDGQGYVTTTVPTFLDKILQSLKSTYEDIKEFLGKIIPAPIEDLVKKVVSYFTDDSKGVKSFDETIFGKIFNVVSDGLNDVLEFFGVEDLSLIEFAGSALESAMFLLQDAINGFVEFLAGIDLIGLATQLGNITLVMSAAGGIKGLLDIIKFIKTPFEVAADALRGIIKDFKKGQFARNVLMLATAIGILALSLYTITEKIDENHLLNGIMTIGILGTFLLVLSQAIGFFDLSAMPGAGFLRSSAILLLSVAIEVIGNVLKLVTELVSAHGVNVAWAIAAMGALMVLTVYMYRFFSSIETMASFGDMISLLLLMYAIKMISKALKTVTELISEHGFNVAWAIAAIGGLMTIAVYIYQFFSSIETMATFGNMISLLMLVYAVKMISTALKSVTELISAHGALNVGLAILAIGGLMAIMVYIYQFFSQINKMATIGNAISLVILIYSVQMISKALKTVTELVSAHGFNVAWAIAAIGGLMTIAVYIYQFFGQLNKMATIGNAISLVILIYSVQMISKALKTVTELISTHGALNVGLAILAIGGLMAVVVYIYQFFSQLNKMATIGNAISLAILIYSVQMITKALKTVTELVSAHGFNVVLAILAIGGLMAVATYIYQFFSQLNKMVTIGNVISFDLLMYGIKMVAKALKSVTELISAHGFNVAWAIAAIGGLMTIVLYMYQFFSMSKSFAGIFDMVSLLVFAYAIRAIGNIVKQLAKIENQGNVWSAVGVVAVIGLILAGISTIVGSAGLITTGNDILGLLAVAGCITLLAQVIGGLARIKEGKLWDAAGALSLITVVFTACANFIPIGARASSGLVAMIAVTAVLGILIGGMSKLGGDNMLEAAEALAIAMATFLVAGYAVAGLGGLGMAVGAGIVVMLSLILVVGLLGILADACVDLEPKMEAAAEFLGGVGSALGAFVGGFMGGLDEHYAKHLPAIGNYIAMFTRVTNAIDNDAFEEGLQKLKDMSTTMASIGWDTILAGFANMLGRIWTTEDEDGVIQEKEINIWEQFKERAKKLAEALTEFQTQMNTVSKITIPVEEIEALSHAIENLPFNRGGFLSLFTGNELATEEDVAAFKQVGILLADAFVAFSNEIPEDLKVSNVRAANSFLNAIGDLGNTLLGLWQNGWTGSQFTDNFETFKTSMGELGGLLAETSKKDINSESLNSIASATGSLGKLFTDLGGVELPDGDISDSTKVTDLVTNLSTLVSSVVEYAGNDFDGADRIKTMADKLNSIKLDGDLTDSNKVDAFTNAVGDLSYAFSEAAGLYVSNGPSTGLPSGVEGMLDGAVNSAVSSLGDSFSKVKDDVANQLYESAGVDPNGENGILPGFLKDLLGIGEDGKLKADGILGDLGLSGEDGIFGDLKGDIEELVGEFTGKDGLGGMLNDFKNSFSGKDGINTELLDFSNILGGLGGDGEEEMSGLIGQVQTLKDLMTTDAKEGGWTITPVIDMDSWNEQYAELEKSVTNGINLSPDFGTLVQANIDLSPVTGAVGELKTSNETGFGNVKSAVDDLVTKVADLASAINTIQLRLDTGTLVGEITPMVNREMGGLIVQG